MSLAVPETASRTFGRVAWTPRYSCAWFGVAGPMPTPPAVIVLPDVDAARPSRWAGGALMLAGRDRLIARAVRLLAVTATKTPQTTSKRVCACTSPLKLFGRAERYARVPDRIPTVPITRPRNRISDQPASMAMSRSSAGGRYESTVSLRDRQAAG